MNTGIMQKEIRGLCWWQPFGTLMLYDKVETRKWDTKYRGLVLICTTKTPFTKQSPSKKSEITLLKDHELEIDSWRFVEKSMPYDTSNMNGYAIGIGMLSDCRKVKMSDKTYFLHGPELYAHIYSDVKRIKPFQVKGIQGWLKLTSDTKAKIEFL